MSRRREVEALVKAATDQGFRCQPTHSGVRILGKDGRSTVGAHWTYSDHRSIRNLRAALRRLGVKV
ncbi:hypothetical protein [Nocardioides panzhihuensis]|uniref:5-enolpyruvylshikimate-3-phosphate synthase n=1 Tax=Nocardioides panzhihuensis TaxID=860243 RepID=A0A7Z0DJQ2_9ACTN|nr:hypothetical protein [Nocardioides panzhihuensis]NYI76637.1 5-enolpyruvylshikimate-3-phosphate synthase [Nocardioides panzhihuensis]